MRNRSTNLNAKSHDGTTPLILSVRMAVEGMVEELIKSDADINLTDEYGKTPDLKLRAYLRLLLSQPTDP